MVLERGIGALRDGLKFVLEFARNVVVVGAFYVIALKINDGTFLFIASILRQVLFIWFSTSLAIFIYGTVKPLVKITSGEERPGYMLVGLTGLSLGLSYLWIGNVYNELVFRIVRSQLVS